MQDKAKINMSTDKAGVLVCLMASVLCAWLSWSGFAELREVRAIAVDERAVVAYRIRRGGSSANRSNRAFVGYYVPPNDVRHETQIGMPQWADFPRGTEFDIHFVPDAPELSIIDYQRAEEKSVILAILSFVAAGCAAGLGVAVVMLRSPMKVQPSPDGPWL